MSGTVETELRKLEKIVPGLLKTDEKMEMVGLKFSYSRNKLEPILCSQNKSRIKLSGGDS